MAQCSVHENPNPASRGEAPFLLDIQSDLLANLATRLVVPLVRKECLGMGLMTRLTPLVRFQDLELVALVPEMAAIPRRHLGSIVGDLAHQRGEMLKAIDLLVTGF